QFNGVSGSLGDMTVLEIVQSLELGRKSAQVVVQYEDTRAGEIGVIGGEIKGAVAGSKSGEEAFLLLARPGPGLFRIEYRAPAVPLNIGGPNTSLMVEALKRGEESAATPPAAIAADLIVHEPPPPAHPPAYAAAAGAAAAGLVHDLLHDLGPAPPP